MGTSRFLEAFQGQSRRYPDRVAYCNSRHGESDSITYGQLACASDALAEAMASLAPVGKPVVVYGHKSPFMLVAFLAAVKSGRAYAPVDVAYPADRVNDIMDQIDHPLVVALSDGDFPGDATRAWDVWDEAAVREICRADMRDARRGSVSLGPAQWVTADDVFYLLFTSGSTGRPKGVQMPSTCVDSFMDYFGKFFPPGTRRVSFNRVPFTFDVSLFDIIAGLAAGYTLFALEAECEQSMSAMFRALHASDLSVWISTPSFVEMCLADPSFNEELLPCLDTVLLCGEVLRNTTALKILDRFPRACLFNTYGPTETQAVSDIQIDRDLIASANPLPVGFLNPAIEAIVCDGETGKQCVCGQIGEVFLQGATVSLGYFGRPDLTAAAFTSVTSERGGVVRRYRTGDKGYLDAEGRLYCLGRLDFQVKINGFRVELGDVEQGLVSTGLVQEAAVLPVERGSGPARLTAHVVLADKSMQPTRQTTKAIKDALRTSLPDYMIPHKICFHDTLPLNVNGKIDRKALAD